MNSRTCLPAPPPGRSGLTSPLRPLRSTSLPVAAQPTHGRPLARQRRRNRIRRRPRGLGWESHVHATGVGLSIVMEAGKLLSRNVTLVCEEV